MAKDCKTLLKEIKGDLKRELYLVQVLEVSMTAILSNLLNRLNTMEIKIPENSIVLFCFCINF
jgi:hypothetical protein